jgi:hypothetical protein
LLFAILAGFPDLFLLVLVALDPQDLYGVEFFHVQVFECQADARG